MKTAKEKAEDLASSFRMILMNEDTDCGNEILCTSIAKKNALIAVDEIIRIKLLWYQKDTKELDYWQEVKQEIYKL